MSVSARRRRRAAAFGLVASLIAMSVPRSAVATVTPSTSYDGAYVVSWTDASGTGGVTAKLAQSLNGGAWTTTAVTGTTSKSFSAMPNGTYAYKLQVYEYDAELRKALLSYERSLGSVLVTTLAAPTAPGALTGPASSGTGSYTISWGAAGPVVTRYELQENGTQIYSGTALSAALAGKKDGTFTYRARACNTAGSHDPTHLAALIPV